MIWLVWPGRAATTSHVCADQSITILSSTVPAAIYVAVAATQFQLGGRLRVNFVTSIPAHHAGESHGGEYCIFFMLADVRLSLYEMKSLFVYLSARLSVYMSTSSPVNLFICVLVYMFVCLPVYL